MDRLRRFLCGMDILLLLFVAGTAAERQMQLFFKQKEQLQPIAVMGSDTRMEEKKIALTFDDGPNPEYTEALLDGLKERGVKATFFLLGREVEKYPQIVQDIYQEGHLIGNHSYEHVDLSRLQDTDAVTQVDLTNNAIHEITGEYPQYIRPPFGSWKSNLDYETTMIEVLWDIDPRDWENGNAQTVAQTVVTNVQENDIILLHDASQSSVEAAFAIVDELKRQGYQFVTVDEILFD